MTDGDTGIDHRTLTNPHIVADGDGLPVFRARVSLMRIKRVGCGVDVGAWSDQGIFSDANLTYIEKDTIKIGIEVFPDMDVIPIIAPKGWLDEGLSVAMERNPE